MLTTTKPLKQMTFFICPINGMSFESVPFSRAAYFFINSRVFYIKGLELFHFKNWLVPFGHLKCYYFRQNDVDVDKE